MRLPRIRELRGARAVPILSLSSEGCGRSQSFTARSIPSRTISKATRTDRFINQRSSVVALGRAPLRSMNQSRSGGGADFVLGERSSAGPISWLVASPGRSLPTAARGRLPCACSRVSCQFEPPMAIDPFVLKMALRKALSGGRRGPHRQYPARQVSTTMAAARPPAKSTITAVPTTLLALCGCSHSLR